MALVSVFGCTFPMPVGWDGGAARTGLRTFSREIASIRHDRGWELVRVALSRILATDPDEFRFTRVCDGCGHPRHGKPRLLGNRDIDFNLSHAGTLALVAVSLECAVGVDVEIRTRDMEACAAWVASPDERSDPAGTVGTWVKKEALLKADGRGLSIAMREVDLDCLPGRTQVKELQVPEPGLSETYIAALAGVGAESLEVEWRDIVELCLPRACRRSGQGVGRTGPRNIAGPG
jgi:phosphopantetheinyl transferase